MKRCDILNEFDANDTKTKHIDAWLSLVERCVRDAEVAGSNPVASTPWQGHRKHLSFKFPVFFNQTASQLNIDAWLSLVERCVRDAEVASSNLVASTNKKWDHSYEWFHFFITDFYNIELVISSGTNAVRDADGIIQKRH